MQRTDMDEQVFIPKGLDPNDEQETIQLARHPYVIVEANAGAAKTATLARRIGQALLRGAPPASILALTYTEPACDALDRALRKVGIDALTRRRIRILTFEQFAKQVLREIEGEGVTYYESPEQARPAVMRAAERVIRNLDERYPEAIHIPGSDDGVVEQYLRDFLHLKGTMQLTVEAADRALTPDMAAELGRDYALLLVFRAYESERRDGHPDRPRFRYHGDCTYDLARLLLSDELGLLPQHPLQLGLSLIAVDEMHDMNRAMFTVLQGLLKANRRTAFIGVGDRDQVIHAMAGADPRFLGAAFDEEIGQAKRYPLTASYRFGTALARAAGQLAHKRYGSQSKRKTKVVVQGLAAHEAEAAVVAAAQQRCGLDAKSPWSEFAVLIRHPHQSIGLENRLLQAGVPYRVVGFDSYLLRPEVLLLRGLLAYARDDYSAIENAQTRQKLLGAMLLFARAKVDTGDAIADERGDSERDALKAIAENPRLIKPFLENQVLRNGAPDATRRIRSALEMAQRASDGVLLEDVVRALDVQHLAAKALVEVGRVRQVAQNMSALVASARACDSTDAFFAQLNAFEMRLAELQGKDCITLSSIAAAKGLEFDHVVLPNMTAGQFAVAGNSADDRNLFYVAITRAKSLLTICCDPQRPSRFLADAGLAVPVSGAA